jgi:two-component system chemotaxis response regulator CheY
MRFLIVDGDRRERLFYKLMLRWGGFESVSMTEAGQGVEALEVLSRDKPDLIISAWTLPDMSGLDFITEAKRRNPAVKVGFTTPKHRDDWGEQLPIVAQIREEATKAGALFVVTKPITATYLRHSIEPVLV